MSAPLHQHHQTPGKTVDGPAIGPGFHWEPIACDDPNCYGVYLRQGSVLVATVSNLLGQWRTHVDMQLLRGAKTATAPNLEAGMGWVAKWARPRQARLISQCLASQRPFKH